MGGVACNGNPCGLRNAGQNTMEFHPNSKPSREQYLTHGLDHSVPGAADAQGAGYQPKAVADKSMTPRLSLNRAEAGTTGDADAAGGADFVSGMAADSYSSNYFGREATELPELPMPKPGEADMSRRRHVFRTGAIYDGQWKGKERHGFGVQTWSDGASYHGQWRNNCATGIGRFRHNDGDVYTGEWRQNIAHGNGIYQHRDSTKYEGQFVSDLQDGDGIESWPDNSQFVGQFSRGKKSGHGLYEWPDGSRYAGKWSENQIDGVGSYFGSDGRRFDGRWSQSTMHGCGRYEWPDGRRYAGQYLEDQKDGFGIFTWADGRRYEGYWSEGRQHGLGRLCHESGGTRLAEWHAGERMAWRDDTEDGMPSITDRG